MHMICIPAGLLIGFSVFYVALMIINKELNFTWWK